MKINKKELLAIKDVYNYMIADELKSWEESGKKGKHIYNQMVHLQKIITRGGVA